MAPARCARSCCAWSAGTTAAAAAAASPNVIALIVMGVLAPGVKWPAERGQYNRSGIAERESVKRVEQAGGIAVRREAGRWTVLLVRARRDPTLWIFPKGHIEPG